MKLAFEPDHLNLLALIASECEQNQEVYLVGGAVRDALLGESLHDMDFVLADNPTALAKRLANRLNAGFFVLDDERHTARVVYYDSEERYFPLDFVQYTGSDLAEDLHNRDFTINAIALPVNTPTHLIDPLGGQGDLAEKLLRPCSEHALTDDPVRVLRGVRLAIQFGFEYAPGLELALQTAANQLPKTSYERQRDEFFRLLAGSNPAEGLRHCWRLRIFDTLIPALADLDFIPTPSAHPVSFIEHTLKQVEAYQRLLIGLIDAEAAPVAGEAYLQDAQHVLGKFSAGITAYFSEAITPGRPKVALAIFGALLKDIGKPIAIKNGLDADQTDDHAARFGAELAWQSAKRLQLSNAESEWVRKLVRDNRHLLPHLNQPTAPDRRTVFRFFNEAGEVGVAIALLSLADLLVTQGSNLGQDQWRHALSVVKIILEAWWEQRGTVVAPTPLMDGHDLQEAFGLEPGKQIGSLLSLLVEEQASGNISSIEEAHEFVRQQLSGSSENEGDR
jgi:poly(A) polymerase